MLGILIPEFPTQTHIFFWREISEFRRLGVPVRVLSTRRPATDACRHAFASDATAETHYVFPPRWARAAATLAARPLRTLAGVRYILGLRETPLRKRMKYLGLIPCAADLLAVVTADEIRHIHAHSCADAAHVVALCRLLGGPTYSLTLHGDLPVYGTDHASKMAEASCVTCAGPHLKTQIVERVGLPADRVMPTWMGLDTDHFHDAARRAFDAGRLHMVTVARLDACKGHRHALAAMARAVERGVDVRYTLVGEGPERAEIEALVRRLDLEGRVELLGTCGESRVLEVLHDADVFVLPSVGFGEAAPVSLMEAMACGLPVVSSIIGSTPVMVDDGAEGVLTAQGDERAIEEAVCRLARDTDLRRRMGAAARARAVRQFGVRDATIRVARFIERHAAVRLLPPERVDPVPDRAAALQPSLAS
ncbi:glycosyl transferase group 1 [Gemmatirosa kalamazoonensis]|uniref:Glycosyl transferase group 1 n=1 Tax=Gemmatirosa kalamazoonensis TaxID=861299 RepID=W0RBH6_9BACT|nr:glycosyltransferase [Gemmatirosa kalamazoonensis]AHG87665.1 glycosyl transferase group 1 [Gemmatirosa kalamazoonensis]